MPSRDLLSSTWEPRSGSWRPDIPKEEGQGPRVPTTKPSTELCSVFPGYATATPSRGGFPFAPLPLSGGKDPADPGNQLLCCVAPQHGTDSPTGEGSCLRHGAAHGLVHQAHPWWREQPAPWTGGSCIPLAGIPSPSLIWGTMPAPVRALPPP